MPTYLVVNAHGGGGTQDQAFARWVEEMNPDVALISETGEVRDNVHKLVGYKVFGDIYIPGENAKGKRDCAIAVRENMTGRDYEARKLTKDLGRPIAPDRWWAKVLLNHRAIYSLHANAVIQNRRTGEWLSWAPSLAWYTAMWKINRAFKEDQQLRHRLVAAGDMNWSLGRNTSLIKRSPQWLAKKRGLDYVTTELMWFMWDPRYFKKVEHRVIPGDGIPTGVGDAHPHKALWVELTHLGGPR